MSVLELPKYKRTLQSQQTLKVWTNAFSAMEGSIRKNLFTQILFSLQLNYIIDNVSRYHIKQCSEY